MSKLFFFFWGGDAFKVNATSLKLENRLHTYSVGMNTQSRTKVILIYAHLINWLMRSELNYFAHRFISDFNDSAATLIQHSLEIIKMLGLAIYTSFQSALIYNCLISLRIQVPATGVGGGGTGTLYVCRYVLRERPPFSTLNLRSGAYHFHKW